MFCGFAQEHKRTSRIGRDLNARPLGRTLNTTPPRRSMVLSTKYPSIIMSSGLMPGGLMSYGLISSGLISTGLISTGLISTGLMSDGLLSCWLMFDHQLDCTVTNSYLYPPPKSVITPYGLHPTPSHQPLHLTSTFSRSCCCYVSDIMIYGPSTITTVTGCQHVRDHLVVATGAQTAQTALTALTAAPVTRCVS